MFRAPLFALACLIAPAAAQDPATLYDTCFARTYDREHMVAHAGQRVQAINVYFQSFEDTLLASVSYTLRFGAKFGFSGECGEAINGGFLCHACANDSCEMSGESFKVLWSGGDRIELVNDATGVVAENAEGGRDYLRAGGEHEIFVMHRGTPAECAW